MSQNTQDKAMDKYSSKGSNFMIVMPGGEALEMWQNIKQMVVLDLELVFQVV